MGTKNRKEDRGQESAEPWEVEYMHREFPVKSEEELERAVQECKKEAKGNRDRRKLTGCVERKISY